jgi:hypothetical protein
METALAKVAAADRDLDELTHTLTERNDTHEPSGILTLGKQMWSPSGGAARPPYLGPPENNNGRKIEITGRGRRDHTKASL